MYSGGHSFVRLADESRMFYHGNVMFDYSIWVDLHMIVKICLKKSATLMTEVYIHVDSLGDIMLKGTAFKKYEFLGETEDGHFFVTAQPPDGGYPKLIITNAIPTGQKVEVWIPAVGANVLEWVMLKALRGGE